MKPGRLKLAVLVSACIALAACGDGGVTSPGTPDLAAPQLQKEHGRRGRLLRCQPLEYDSVTASVGPRGATLRVSGHVLQIPRNALRRRTRITAVVPSDNVNLIRFEPEGLVFRRPVKLTMTYANCNASDSTYARRIAYTDESLEILEYEPSWDDFDGRQVTGLLKHFSRYAVSW